MVLVISIDKYTTRTEFESPELNPHILGQFSIKSLAAEMGSGSLFNK